MTHVMLHLDEDDLSCLIRALFYEEDHFGDEEAHGELDPDDALYLKRVRNLLKRLENLKEHTK